jgi:hypothetical protein
LADFAKLVELFDAHGVSFVSVTQQFNTTTSMGRLTLNVLLSFAQFEREVTSERIRDKIAASKRKGLWVGGPLPLGYEMKDSKIAVVEDEAERVRLIYRRYLELSGVNALVRDLKDKDIRTKIRLRATGATHGGIPFERGTLFYLLRNRFYIGEVKYKGEILPGEQPAIMERELFDAVQQKLTDQWSHRNHAKSKSDHLLTGLLYDDAGHRMIPTHATKAGIRYRYYVSLPHLKGESNYLLRNRFYIGEVKYKDEILPGEQPAIMDRALFDAVQQKLSDQWTNRTTVRNASDHFLTGLLFDDAGHRMVPTHATKAGIRYR